MAAGSAGGGLQLKISSKPFEFNEKLNLQKSYVIDESKEEVENDQEDTNMESNQDAIQNDANQLLEFSE